MRSHLSTFLIVGLFFLSFTTNCNQSLPLLDFPFNTEGHEFIIKYHFQAFDSVLMYKKNLTGDSDLVYGKWCLKNSQGLDSIITIECYQARPVMENTVKSRDNVDEIECYSIIAKSFKRKDYSYLVEKDNSGNEIRLCFDSQRPLMYGEKRCFRTKIYKKESDTYILNYDNIEHKRVFKFDNHNNLVKVGYDLIDTFNYAEMLYDSSNATKKVLTEFMGQKQSYLYFYTNDVLDSIQWFENEEEVRTLFFKYLEDVIEINSPEIATSTYLYGVKAVRYIKIK
ncbi:MAG: hypothetical protein GC181_09730 [Bacteroidetes bacterium]|nr:hypothetical protein [Bacteroidota bacterium]